MENTFFGKSFLTAESLTKESLEQIFKRADKMKKLVQEKGGNLSLQGKIMATMFYEPSSRTFSSFVSAIQRLGGGFIPLNGMSNTSVAKGESLSDTAKVFSCYADVLVIRNPETGSAQALSEYASVPVINAGDGIGEHPTQALLDAYTIRDEYGSFDNLHIVFVGEFAHYRPVNSLSKLLALFPTVQMSFVSAKEVALQEGTRAYLRERNVKFAEYEDLDEVIADADVLYVNRAKKEFIPAELYEKIYRKFIIDANTLKKMKKRSMIMHPLPRLEEISTEVDADPRAVYLKKQMQNGLYVRMALLELILKK